MESERPMSCKRRRSLEIGGVLSHFNTSSCLSSVPCLIHAALVRCARFPLLNRPMSTPCCWAGRAVLLCDVADLSSYTVITLSAADAHCFHSFLLELCRGARLTNGCVPDERMYIEARPSHTMAVCCLYSAPMRCVSVHAAGCGAAH